MNFSQLQRIDVLVQAQCTGTPKQLAAKLDCSERMIYTYVNFLRTELGAPLAYSRKRSTYYYMQPGTLTFQGFAPYQGRTNSELTTEISLENQPMV